MRAGLLVCGNLNIDHILSVKFLPKKGESAPISLRRTEHGGCGGNIAYSASLLGVHVSISSAIGDDFDPDYQRRLNDLPIDLSGLHVIKGRLSPMCTILSDPNGGQCYAFFMGAMEQQNELPVPEAHEYCHIVTSDPGFSVRVAAEQERDGAQVAFDPGQEIFFRWNEKNLKEVLEHSNRFFGNVGEWAKVAELMGWSGVVVSEANRDVETFPEAFDMIEEAVITDGRNGAYLIDRGGVFHSPARDVVVLDPTGAGDAFRGGYYGALLHQRTGKEALCFGNCLAARAITCKGAQNFSASWKEMEKNCSC